MNRLSERARRTYIRNAILVLITGFLGTILITKMVNSRIQDIFINEAVNLSESYSQLLNLSTTANKNLEKSINNRLSIILRTSAQYEEDLINNPEHLKRAAQISQISVINIFNEEGELIASSMPEYIGEVLPKKHPVRRFIESDTTLFHDRVRKSKHTNNRLKHSYIRTPSNHIIQASVTYQSMAYMSDDFHPMHILNSLKTDIDVIDIEMIFDDAIDLIVLEEIPIVYMTPFKANARHSNDVIWKINKETDRSILEVGVPVIHENKRIGTLIVSRNLSAMDSIKDKAINMTFSLAALIMILSLLEILHSYKKEKQTEEASYIGSHEGIFNKHYLTQYINQNANRMISEKDVFLIINFNAYDRFKLILDEMEFKNAIHEIKDIILNDTTRKNEIFEYDDSTLILLYEYDMFPDDYKERIKTLEEAIGNYEVSDNYFLIKSGILLIDENYDTSYDIEIAIDNAVSTIKLESSDPLIVFGEELWDQFAYQQKLQNALRKAYLNEYEDDFYVVFQPKILDDSKLIGFEALSRWCHPVLGYISPADFIPIAEDRDLIISLGERVLIDTFKFIHKLYALGFEDFIVSVNFSYKQLKSPYFLERFLTLSKIHKVDLRNVGIEVTESIMIDDFESLNCKLHELQALGISIYLDDFGVGYSSLERVKHMPLDYIKIDRSFIELIDTDPALVDSIFDLVKNLETKVVAEGVETNEQLTWLNNKTNVIIQGYYYSQPLKEDEALEFAKKYKPN